MSTNCLSTSNEETLSFPDYISPEAPGEVANEERLSSVALLRSMIRRYGRELPIRRLLSRPVEFQNYRIGLIPIENVMNPASLNGSVPAKTNSVLFLPLTWNELVLHLQDELRQAKQEDETVRIGAVTISFSRMEASCSEKRVALTALHFKVLHYFAKNPGRAISREELLRNVWGYNNYPTTRTVDNIMMRLRHSLEPEPAKPIYFLTVHGFGYKLNLAQRDLPDIRAGSALRKSNALLAVR